MTNNIFAVRLKEIRDDKGLSQEALGKMVNLSKATISKYETGIHPPNSTTLSPLHRLLTLALAI